MDGQSRSRRRSEGPGVRRSRPPPAELRPHPGPRRGLLPAAGQLGRLPRGPATRLADRRAERSRGPVRRRAPRRPRVLPAGRRTGLRHGAHARCPVPLLDAVHGALRNRPLGSGSTPPRCSTTSGRRRERSAVWWTPRSSPTSDTLALAGSRCRTCDDRHVSPPGVVPALRRRRCRDRTRCRARARSGRSRSSCSPRSRRTRCRAPTSVRTSSGTSTSAAR